MIHLHINYYISKNKLRVSECYLWIKSDLTNSKEIINVSQTLRHNKTSRICLIICAYQNNTWIYGFWLNLGEKLTQIRSTRSKHLLRLAQQGSNNFYVTVPWQANLGPYSRSFLPRRQFSRIENRTLMASEATRGWYTYNFLIVGVCG